MKMMNLSHDWLSAYLPHVLSKIDRVSFGLLSAEDLARALAIDPKVPISRRLLAVPFVGKDVPSTSSEFSHPDVVIGLTIAAYRFEGLRHSDFELVMDALQKDMVSDFGPYNKRRSCKCGLFFVGLMVC